VDPTITQFHAHYYGGIFASTNTTTAFRNKVIGNLSTWNDIFLFLPFHRFCCVMVIEVIAIRPTRNTAGSNNLFQQQINNRKFYCTALLLYDTATIISVLNMNEETICATKQLENNFVSISWQRMLRNTECKVQPCEESVGHRLPKGVQ
jgi:hypothetical protein